MFTSKLTSKGRTTIPQAVRAALRLNACDEIGYQIAGDRVVLTRVHPGLEEPFGTFDEWDFEADRKAYADL